MSWSSEGCRYGKTRVMSLMLSWLWLKALVACLRMRAKVMSTEKWVPMKRDLHKKVRQADHFLEECHCKIAQ